MPTFNDSDNKLMFQPAGDYIFTVIGHESKISAGGKTAGAPTDNLKLELTAKDGTKSTMYETLIDHPSTGWKYDTFLKSAGVKLQKGQSFELTADPNAVNGINPLGLRGHCHVTVDEWQGKKKNKVDVFYTDREKLPRAVIQDESQAADDAAFGAKPEDDNIPFA